MDIIKNNSYFGAALINWLAKFSAQGLLVTDAELNIRFYNEWFARRCAKNEAEFKNRNLLAVFPELSARGFDRYYQSSLKGQSRILSHQFHKYLIEMPPTVAVAAEITQMQQSARISPLFADDKIIGTITVIEDVTERVAREMQLNLQIEERERLLSSERIARQLAEENSRLKDSNELLRLETLEISESEQTRGKFLHQIISAQEEERKRISRNIHDHLGQQMTALRLILSSLKDQSPSEQLDKAYVIAETLDAEVDFLAWELRPTVLDDLGLVKALENSVREWSRYLLIPVEFHTTGLKGRRLPPDVEINLYRIVQEALNNVSKHARARHVSVLLEKQNNSVVLIIEDDGDGFDLNEKESLTGKGLGLLGIKERALLIGGTAQIESAVNNGTTVFVRIPMAGLS